MLRLFDTTDGIAGGVGAAAAVEMFLCVSVLFNSFYLMVSN